MDGIRLLYHCGQNLGSWLPLPSCTPSFRRYTTVLMHRCSFCLPTFTPAPSGKLACHPSIQSSRLPVGPGQSRPKHCTPCANAFSGEAHLPTRTTIVMMIVMIIMGQVFHYPCAKPDRHQPVPRRCSNVAGDPQGVFKNRPLPTLILLLYLSMQIQFLAHLRKVVSTSASSARALRPHFLFAIPRMPALEHPWHRSNSRHSITCLRARVLQAIRQRRSDSESA